MTMSDSSLIRKPVQSSFSVTRREAEVLNLAHLRYRDIGSLLGISESTVKLHMRSAKEKLGAETNVQAALIWQERKAA